MKKTILTTAVIIALAITTSSNAQVGIGVSTADRNPSAQLDVFSTTKGFLPPRMTYAQRNAIVNPGAGLIIYCTNCGTNGEMQYYNATNWMSMEIGVGSVPPLTIGTLDISNILVDAATCGGNITYDGGANVTARGVCWSTSSNPTIALSTKTVDGTGVVSFTSSITGLTYNTTYYVRSYATNEVGTAYGNEVIFTTLLITVPTISTATISNLLAGGATCGGNISADGNGTISERGVCWSTSSNPTIALSTKTVDGTGIGSFTSSITGLTQITTYYVRSYATNEAGTAYGNEVVFTTVTAGTIGTKVWTTQNLNVSTYRNGDSIPKVENGVTWGSITYGAYCYYNNDSATYAAIYGKLYNWYAVNDPRGLAPVGYHIPTDDEWTTLTEYLGGNDLAGGKIKEAGTSHWITPNTGADNSSGLAGLPGGFRNQYGACNYIGGDGFWWSSTLNYSTLAWYRRLDYNWSGVDKINGYAPVGMSVRCIKD